MAFIEPCFGIGHNLSLICQMTSEDIKHQLIIIINNLKDVVSVIMAPVYTLQINARQELRLKEFVHYATWRDGERQMGGGGGVRIYFAAFCFSLRNVVFIAICLSNVVLYINICPGVTESLVSLSV